MIMLNVGKTTFKQTFLYLVNNFTDILPCHLFIINKVSYVLKWPRIHFLCQNSLHSYVIYYEIYIHEIRSKKHKWNRIWYWSIFCQIFLLHQTDLCRLLVPCCIFVLSNIWTRSFSFSQILLLIWCKKHANIWVKFELLR